MFTLIYIPIWLSASIGSDTAIHDFYFLKDMILYKQNDSEEQMQH